MWSRLKPAFALLILAPLISEYLLGSLGFGQLWLFPIMVPMYGGGALLVRELTRRNGRGWPTILTLGLVFGVIEEGLATQSLFNPNYLGLHLLRYGFVPALGIGAPWTVHVILLHAIWSIAVPVGLVEALFSEQRHTPWLGRPGLATTGVVYGLGVALIAFGSWKKEQFVASQTQLLVTALVALALAAGAFVCFPTRRDSEELAQPAKWPPWTWGLLAFASGSMFHLLAQFGGTFLPPAASVVGLVFFPIAVLVAVHAGRKSGGWTFSHTDALVLGGLFVYCWLGFFLTARLRGVNTIPGQLFPCLAILALVCGRFIRRRKA